MEERGVIDRCAKLFDHLGEHHSDQNFIFYQEYGCFGHFSPPESLGHRVVAEAGNIRDGVALAGMAVFDFAILDVNIGGYSISPVAEIIAERGLPFFFVSGYGAAGRPEAYSYRPVLQKPVLMAELGEAINSILSTGNVSARGA